MRCFGIQQSSLYLSMNYLSFSVFEFNKSSVPPYFTGPGTFTTVVISNEIFFPEHDENSNLPFRDY